MSEKPRCKTCRWWDTHSIDMHKGDCRVPGDHRYSRVPRLALLDSFGPEETAPNHVCGRWDDGKNAPGRARAHVKND